MENDLPEWTRVEPRFKGGWEQQTDQDKRKREEKSSFRCHQYNSWSEKKSKHKT